MNGIEIEKLQEFDGHRLVTFVADAKAGLRGFIAIHRGGLVNPALGATRVWEYETEVECLRDALRLSRIMSYKAALAGLKYGGAKAVLMASPEFMKSRKSFFRAYAEKVNYLGGRFITGTDVGVDNSDVESMKEKTSYVIGSKVDPAYFTALGVFYGIHDAFKHATGSASIRGKAFAIQGVGKTGSKILDLLYRDAKEIFIADTNLRRIREIKKQFPKVHVVPVSQIHRQEADVFVPCALSGVLNGKSVSELRCNIVAGSANNQLEDVSIGVLLHKLGILYVPDYAVNAGGLLSVVEEMKHEVPNERRIKNRIGRARKILQSILRKSKRQNKATSVIANEMAERIFNNRR